MITVDSLYNQILNDIQSKTGIPMNTSVPNNSVEIQNIAKMDTNSFDAVMNEYIN